MTMDCLWIFGESSMYAIKKAKLVKNQKLTTGEALIARTL